MPAAKVKLGLSINDPRAFRGYTLLNPMNKKTTYLIDMEGRVVKTWESEHNSMHGRVSPGKRPSLPRRRARRRRASLRRRPAVRPGGSRSSTWDGEVVWDFKFHNAKQLPHHDAVKLPNGNVLMVVWDKKTADEAIAAGRKKELVSNYLLPDSILEVKPTGKTTGEVVWEWHLWDHLIQDHDSTKANFGDVAAHPELVDINFVESSLGPGPGRPAAGPPPRPRPARRRTPPKMRPRQGRGRRSSSRSAMWARRRSGRSASIRTGPTSMRSTITPRSIRS